MERKALDSCGKKSGAGDPTGGTPRRLPSLPAESKCLERNVTDNFTVKATKYSKTALN
jgi:hypothetical protein